MKVLVGLKDGCTQDGGNAVLLDRRALRPNPGGVEVVQVSARSIRHQRDVICAVVTGQHTTERAGPIRADFAAAARIWMHGKVHVCGDGLRWPRRSKLLKIK